MNIYIFEVVIKNQDKNRLQLSGMHQNFSLKNEYLPHANNHFFLCIGFFTL